MTRSATWNSPRKCPADVPNVAEIWDKVQRGGGESLPEALLLFDAWPENENTASFRTRIVSDFGEGLVPGGGAQVVWIRKRSEGVFSRLIGIGRTRNNDIVLPMAGVSKYHAYIQKDAETDTYTIADAGSKNGTLVDGSMLSPRHPMELQDNTPVSFAGNGCRFRLTKAFLASLAASAR